LFGHTIFSQNLRATVDYGGGRTSRDVRTPRTTRSTAMKYVLLYTNRPDLDAAVPEERRAEVYQAIYGWFEKHGAVMTDGGAELQGPYVPSARSPALAFRSRSPQRLMLLRDWTTCSPSSI
jgi:hypothetical protein